MINFWSYKEEFKRYRPNLINIFDKTLKDGQIFFGKNLSTFEKNFKKEKKTFLLNSRFSDVFLPEPTLLEIAQTPRVLRSFAQARIQDKYQRQEVGCTKVGDNDCFCGTASGSRDVSLRIFPSVRRGVSSCWGRGAHDFR